MKLRLARTTSRLNVEHRTSNIELSMWMALRLICYKTNEPQNHLPPDKISKNKFVLLSIFLKLTEYRIRCWTFNVRCSMFIFSKFIV